MSSSSLTNCLICLIFVLVVTLGEECSWRFRSNPDDCGSFLVCDHGAPVLQSCPGGLHWNERILACDWTRSALCNLGVNSVTKDEKEGEQFTGKNELDRGEGDTCDAQFHANPTDCSKYYVCNHGVWLEMSCSQSLVWNPAINSCDWAYNVDCTTTSGEGSPAPPPSSEAPIWESSPSTVGPPAPPPEEENGGDGPPAPPPTTTSKRPHKPSTTYTATPTTSSPSGGGGGDATIVGIITGPVTPASDEEESDVDEYFESDYIIVCYYTGWSWYRPGEGRFGPENVNPELCTHYVYAFAVLDSSTWTMKPADTWVDIDKNFYSQMTQLKKKGRKVTIALGGWNDSGGGKYSLLLRDPAKIETLINSVVKFVKKYDFDGIDLDYEYPVCPHGECKDDYDTDRNGFTILVKGLRAALPKGSVISAAVSANRNIIDRAYDVRTLAESLDWIGVMGYDMHGSWEKTTGHIAPLYHHPDDTKDYLNANYAVRYWIKKGAPPSKLVMGVPLYGQAFTLQDPSNKTLNAPAMGPGTPGQYSRQGGILAYYEICSQTWSERFDDPEGRMGPFLIHGNQWVSFDDENFIRKKMKYVKELGLRGAMAWSLDFDDFNNQCGHGRYPLLKAIKHSLAT